MRRQLCIPVAIVLVATACSADPSTSATDVPPSSTVSISSAASDSSTPAEDVAPAQDASAFKNAAVDSAVEALVRDYGDEGAFAVGVFALERGHDVQQIVDAAMGGLIQTDGSVDGVTPSGPSLGLVVIDPNAVRFISLRASTARDPVTISELQGQLAEASHGLFSDENSNGQGARGALLLATLLGLLANFGVDPAEVIESIILGGSVWDMRRLDAQLEVAELEERADAEAGVPKAVQVLIGSGELVTTDRGEAKTCSINLDNIRATIRPRDPGFSVELTYVRTVAAAVPPGELGDGDPSQYVKCVTSEKTTRHTGSFDVGSGIVLLDDIEVTVITPLTLTVSDGGGSSLEGMIAATDFLNDWTLDMKLFECGSDCD